ncbi:murein transglycosylase [Fusarium austroafricanum]|uniref:Murein transglycosylase n=1 Tax=Fusarium austroafricanum TaxID=2364996 RepID=A0A8H4P9L8_9HYPO|nr:murein transglycosylase [Fusarium austroafricanum]
MKFFGVLSTLLAVASATPAPSKTLDKRATTWCDAFGSLQTAGYTVYHNNWGRNDATSGSQCTTFNSYNQGSFSWSTKWTWAGGNIHVKSYSNVALENINKKVSAIKSIPTKWNWRYTGNGMVADVAYDLWLAPSVGAKNKYEIMIWVGSYGGAGPISDSGSNPRATVNINGVKWKLFRGPNGDTTVFSFVAPSNLGNFQGDLLPFLTYLTKNQGVSSNYVATSFQAGTEPFVGSNCVFTTSAYSLSVK